LQNNWVVIGSSSEARTTNQTKGPMTSENNRPRSLREIEMEVLEEGREWTRRRLEQKLQEEANRQGGVFPPQRSETTSPARAGKWGSEVDDSVVHALVQQAGSQAEAQTQERLKQVPQESQPQRRASQLALLMVDGWFARFRGPGWGENKTKKERVEWHEIKNGVVYLHEQAGRTEGGRGVIADKTEVRCQGDSAELGQRLHWEAVRGGLGRAKETLVLGDGEACVRNLKA